MMDAHASDDRAEPRVRRHGRADMVTAVTLICASVIVVAVSLYRHQTAAGAELSELDETLLPRQPVPIDEADYLGSPASPAVMIAFVDFACPHSRQFHERTLPVLQREYVAPGTLQIVWREFPLVRRHATARLAAKGAACAGVQGRLHDVMPDLFKEAPGLTEDRLWALGQRAGLREPDFRRCVADAALARIVQDETSGRAIGVFSTPTFLIGNRAGTGAAQIRKRITGTASLSRFRQALDAAVRAKTLPPEDAARR